VASVEGGQLALAQSLCGGHDGGVDRPEGEVAVRAGEFGDSDPVGCHDPFGQQVPGREIAQEPNLRIGTEPRAEEIDDLGDDENRNDQRARMRLEEIEALLVMPVVAIDVGVEGAGIDNEGYEATSARRICSIRSDTLDWPLRPAPAARSRRRPFPPPPR
jgi:hypothetical protein